MLATSASCTPATYTPASPSRICRSLFSGRSRSCVQCHDLSPPLRSVAALYVNYCRTVKIKAHSMQQD